LAGHLLLLLKVLELLRGHAGMARLVSLVHGVIGRRLLLSLVLLL
jgi:hypothetical protein